MEEELKRQEEDAKEEITRRLRSVSDELKINGEGLESLAQTLARSKRHEPFVPALPPLFDGVWIANAPRLAQILDPWLVGDLGIFYGQIDELRFRARYLSTCR